MFNNHLQAINTPSPSLPKRGTRKVMFNQEQVEKARRIRTNAEMADTARMGTEVEQRNWGDLPEWERFYNRKQGPSVKQLSHNKNTSSIAEHYSEEWWNYVKREIAA